MAGEPTRKVLNVTVQAGTADLAVSCRFLSGKLALAVSLSFDAFVGDLQSHIHENIYWASSECMDSQSNAIPSHAGLRDCTDFILKEVEHREVTDLDQYMLSYRRRVAADVLKTVKLPVRYEQKESWEDGQGVGGEANIKLEFRTSHSEAVLKFGALIDLQNNAGRRRCDELIRSSKYQGIYKAPYGYFNEECGRGAPDNQVTRSLAD